MKYKILTALFILILCVQSFGGVVIAQSVTIDQGEQSENEQFEDFSQSTIKEINGIQIRNVKNVDNGFEVSIYNTKTGKVGIEAKQKLSDWQTESLGRYTLDVGQNKIVVENTGNPSAIIYGNGADDYYQLAGSEPIFDRSIDPVNAALFVLIIYSVALVVLIRRKIEQKRNTHKKTR